jgi:predicted ester cyclase
MTMDDEQVQSLMQVFVYEPWNAGNLDALNEVASETYRLEDDSNLDDLKEIIRKYRRAFPDLAVTVDDIVAQHDKIAYRWTMRGTHGGEYEGIAPTGKAVTFTGMTFLLLKDGKDRGRPLRVLQPERGGAARLILTGCL